MLLSTKEKRNHIQNHFTEVRVNFVRAPTQELTISKNNKDNIEFLIWGEYMSFGFVQEGKIV